MINFLVPSVTLCSLYGHAYPVILSTLFPNYSDLRKVRTLPRSLLERIR